MGNVRKGAKALYRSRRKGVSLVLSMCVAAVLLTLAMSVIFSASVLLRRAESRVTRERCWYLAQSFASVLAQELTEPDFAEGSFSAYVRSCIADWEAGEAEPFRAAAAAAEDYGTLTVTLRPLEVGTETPAGGSFSYEDSTDAVARIRTENVFVRFRFAVETAASLDGESWACSDAYSCAESYRLRFAWGGVPLYWADGWYADSSCTVPFLPQGEDCLISYDYDTDCVTAVQFLPKAEEGGGGA